MSPGGSISQRVLFLQRITLKRFRSIPAETVRFGDNPTFLVGRNGSGKSNFVDVFAFLSECMSSPLQAVFDSRGGISNVRNRSPGGGYPPHLGLRVDFGSLNGGGLTAHYAFEVSAQPDYGFEVLREQCRVVRRGEKVLAWFDRTRDKLTTREGGIAPTFDEQSLALPAIGGVAEFAPVVRGLAGMRTYSIEPARLREMQDPDSGVVLKPDGSNAASVLRRLQRQGKDQIDRLCELLETIVPGTTNVRPIKHGKKLSLEFTQEWAPGKKIAFEAFAMSDGTLRALGLLTALAQKPPPSLIAIEEPEATIHPGALGALLDAIRGKRKTMQVIVTTHSPEVLDARWIEDRHVRLVSWEKGATRISPLGQVAKEALQEHIMGAGELMRSNVLEADPLFDELDPRQMNLFEALG